LQWFKEPGFYLRRIILEQDIEFDREVNDVIGQRQLTKIALSWKVSEENNTILICETFGLMEMGYP
jgi:hypothetical protein